MRVTTGHSTFVNTTTNKQINKHGDRESHRHNTHPYNASLTYTEARFT